MTPQDHADHLLQLWQQRRNLPPEKRLPPSTTPIVVSEATSNSRIQNGEITKMTVASRDLRSHLLARSVAEAFHSAYIAGNCKSDRSSGYTDLAMQDFKELAEHLGYRLVEANVVQVGDHPPERSPFTPKVVSLGERSYQQKLDAVAAEISDPLYDGAA